MKRHFAGFIILHVIAATLLYAAWRTGVMQSFYAADSYYLASGLTAYTGYGLVCVLCGWWNRVAEVIDDLPTYGLLGTVIGFSIAIGGLVTGEMEVRNTGLQVALNTTIVGLIGSKWLEECKRRLKR